MGRDSRGWRNPESDFRVTAPEMKLTPVPAFEYPSAEAIARLFEGDVNVPADEREEAQQ